MATAASDVDALAPVIDVDASQAPVTDVVDLLTQPVTPPRALIQAASPDVLAFGACRVAGSPVASTHIDSGSSTAGYRRRAFPRSLRSSAGLIDLTWSSPRPLSLRRTASGRLPRARRGRRPPKRLRPAPIRASRPPKVLPSCRLHSPVLRSTRWGRCRECTRAMRPGVTVGGSPYVSCPQWRPLNAHHERQWLTRDDLSRLDFPQVFLRRTRIAF